MHTYNQTYIYTRYIVIKPSKCPASGQAEGLKFLTRPLRNLHSEDLQAIRTKFTPRNGSGAFHPSRKGCTTDKSDFRETWQMQSHQR